MFSFAIYKSDCRYYTRERVCLREKIRVNSNKSIGILFVRHIVSKLPIHVVRYEYLQTALHAHWILRQVARCILALTRLMESFEMRMWLPPM